MSPRPFRSFAGPALLAAACAAALVSTGAFAQAKTSADGQAAQRKPAPPAAPADRNAIGASRADPAVPAKPAALPRKSPIGQSEHPAKAHDRADAGAQRAP